MRNQMIYDLSVKRKVSDKLSLYAEIFSNSSPAHGENGTFSEAVAFEYKFSQNFNVFPSFESDSDQMKNVRSGFNLEVWAWCSIHPEGVSVSARPGGCWTRSGYLVPRLPEGIS